MYGERETSQKTTKNGLLMDTIHKAREGKQECCAYWKSEKTIVKSSWISSSIKKTLSKSWSESFLALMSIFCAWPEQPSLYTLSPERNIFFCNTKMLHIFT